MLSMMRRQRKFTRAVLWVLVVMIAIGLIAVFGNFQALQQSPVTNTQTQQQPPVANTQTQQAQ